MVSYKTCASPKETYLALPDKEMKRSNLVKTLYIPPGIVMASHLFCAASSVFCSSFSDTKSHFKYVLKSRRLVLSDGQFIRLLRLFQNGR